MKLAQIVKITKPKYKYFKLTPNNSIRNNNSFKIARAIASLYRNIFYRIKAEQNKLIKLFGREFLIGTQYRIEAFEKVGFFIYMEKTKVEFYFIIPEQFENLIMEKLKDVWQSITIKEVNTIPTFNNNATALQMVYDKEDALSLNVDRRDNELLRSNLNVTNILNNNDKIGIYYNLMPTTQHTWQSQYKTTINKFKNKEPVDRDKSKVGYLLKYGLLVLTSVIDAVIDAITPNTKGKQQSMLETILSANNKQLSSSTMQKENSIILDTQIVIMSENNNDKIKQINNVKSVAQSFEAITEDNRLVAKRFTKPLNFTAYNLKAQTNKISDKELQSMLSLAGRDILEEFNFIEKVETQETQVPQELQRGIISIGENTFRGMKQMAYLSNDREFKNLCLMVIGPTRAGKSTFLGNMSRDMLNNNECVVIFDFIKNCELSAEITELFDKDKVLNIECDNFNTIQGLGYNEVGYNADPFKQYDNAKRQTTQLLTLINTINTDDTNLSVRMERYLTSASTISFISGGSIKDVFGILQNHNTRHSFINKVPQSQLENLEESITALYELDEADSKTGLTAGTKHHLITGIIDRLNKLKYNTYMELMLKRGTENNFDLSAEIQKPQLICLKMPETMFSTDNERDIYTTYWTTKLWLALQQRANKIKDRSKHTKVNLIIDELYQVENTEKFLTDKLSRLAKFSLKPIFSCHYIDQLKHIRNELRSANASYMLISGCDKNNYKEFKEELYPFTVEDLLNLKRYHSLNLIKNNNGYAKFITKLPF